MDKAKDYKDFAKLMLMVGEAMPGDLPNANKIEIYFLALADLEFQTIYQRAVSHIQFNRFFPTIAELRAEGDLDSQAQVDYQRVHHLCDAFLYPGLYEAGMATIRERLKDRPDLIALVMRHGPEIAQSSNPTATRAQMIKQIKAEKLQQREQLAAPKQAKQLSGEIGKLAESFKRSK